MRNSFEFRSKNRRGGGNKMIYSFLKRILNFFQDFFADLFSFFKGNEKFNVSFDFQANKAGLQPVSRPGELVHYFGRWVEGPSYRLL